MTYIANFLLDGVVVAGGAKCDIVKKKVCWKAALLPLWNMQIAKGKKSNNLSDRLVAYSFALSITMCSDRKCPMARFYYTNVRQNRLAPVKDQEPTSKCSRRLLSGEPLDPAMPLFHLQNQLIHFQTCLISHKLTSAVITVSK